MADNLPGRLIIPTRDEIIAKYKRDYKLRVPGSNTDAGSQVDVDARMLADLSSTVYANALTISQSVSRQTRTALALDDDAKSRGTTRRGASSAVGSVRVRAAGGGGTIAVGTIGVVGGLRYRCTATANYIDGDLVPVQAVDTGATTNQPAGALLVWASPPAGIGPTAIVDAQPDGTGLSGGGAPESDDELRDRLDKLSGTPTVSGNDAEYQELTRSTPGLAVEAAFTYPAIQGSGTICVTFTMRSDSRIPSAAQILEVQNWVLGQMPASDAATFGTVVAHPVVARLALAWQPDVPGWLDRTPWPAATDNAYVVSATDATHFIVHSITRPPEQTTFAVFDGTVFRRKRALDVVADGTNLYRITCDTRYGVSDTAYVPAVGRKLSPWSDSLSSLIAPVKAEFAKLGPGEQTGTFDDPTLRKHRSPSPYRQWPNILSSKFVAAISSLSTVQTADVARWGTIPREPTVNNLIDMPYETPVGSPGLSYLITLGDLCAFRG